MHVTIVCLHTSPWAELGSADAGGMNVVVRRQAEVLAARGHRVDVLTRRSDASLPFSEEKDAGLRLFHLAAGPPRPLAKSVIDDHLDEFRESLRAVEFGDVVHSHHWMSGVAALPVARERGVPHLQSFHSVAALPEAPLSQGEPPESPRRVPGERLVAQGSDLLVCVSRAEAATVVERCGATPERIRVVEPGVDAELFRPMAEGEGRWGGRRYVLFAARLQPLKAPDLAIEALAGIAPERRPELVIAGDVSADFADYWGDLETLIEARGLAGDVRHVGSLARPEFARAVRGAELMLVPSHSETFGLVALEASASGVPVVAAPSGGLREAVLDQETGLLVPSREPNAWARAIESLLEDPARRRAMGEAGRRHAERLSWPAHAERLLNIYRDAAASTVKREDASASTEEDR